jgi:hypothetical protein
LWWKGARWEIIIIVAKTLTDVKCHLVIADFETWQSIGMDLEWSVTIRTGWQRFLPDDPFESVTVLLTLASSHALEVFGRQSSKWCKQRGQIFPHVAVEVDHANETLQLFTGLRRLDCLDGLSLFAMG